jgi:hypothetical protein
MISDDTVSTKSRRQIEDEFAQELSQFEYDTLSQVRDGGSSFIDIGFNKSKAKN